MYLDLLDDGAQADFTNICKERAVYFITETIPVIIISEFCENTNLHDEKLIRHIPRATLC